MEPVPPQYTAHYQDLHTIANRVRLGGHKIESEDMWTGDDTTYVAVEAKV